VQVVLFIVLCVDAWCSIMWLYMFGVLVDWLGYHVWYDYIWLARISRLVWYYNLGKVPWEDKVCAWGSIWVPIFGSCETCYALVSFCLSFSCHETDVLAILHIALWLLFSHELHHICVCWTNRMILPIHCGLYADIVLDFFL